MSANTYLPGSPVVPTFLIITSITQSNPCQLTVSTPNSYIPGQIFRFSVPFDYGMFQINGLSAEILTVDVTNLIFKVALDSTLFDAFTSPTGLVQPATISPAGSRNTYNFTKLPFHSLNGGVGN